MTTIAWDGHTLAGDALGVIGESLTVWSRKIFCLPDGRLFGGSGRYDQVLAVRDWLETGGEKPRLDAFAGIVIDQHRQCYRLEEALICMPIVEPFHAVGSGRDFAIAAMALGEDAIAAIALAARFDLYTGNGIHILHLGDEDGAVETREIACVQSVSIMPHAQRKKGEFHGPTS